MNNFAYLLPTLQAKSIWLIVSWGTLLMLLYWQWMLPTLVTTKNAVADRWYASFVWLGALLILLWCCWPSAASIRFPLGLAFQAPSVASFLLCAKGLFRLFHRKYPFIAAPKRTNPQVKFTLSLIAIALGWVLLLDTLGLIIPTLWVGSIYALGFSPYWLWCVLGLTVLVALTTHAHWRGTVVMMLLALALFTFTHLPRGNGWDVLLDPWLWVYAHLILLRHLFQRSLAYIFNQ